MNQLENVSNSNGGKYKYSEPEVNSSAPAKFLSQFDQSPIATVTRAFDVSSVLLKNAGNYRSAEFSELSEIWREETKHLSFTVDKVNHWAYLRIIGMGYPVLPFLFRELNERPRHWFVALRAITGEDPVPEAGQGKIHEIVAAWLKWGRASGYVR